MGFRMDRGGGFGVAAIDCVIALAVLRDEGQAKMATVFIPEGQWKHIWSGKIYTSRSGQWADIAAPIGQPPVFLRVGAPLQNVLEAAFGTIDRV